MTVTSPTARQCHRFIERRSLETPLDRCSICCPCLAPTARMRILNNSLLIVHSVPRPLTLVPQTRTRMEKKKKKKIGGLDGSCRNLQQRRLCGRGSAHRVPLRPPSPGWWLRATGEARPGPDPRVPGGRRLSRTPARRAAQPPRPHLPKRCARQEEAVSEGSPRSEAATGMLSCKRSTAQGTA